jgi:MFS family permease
MNSRATSRGKKTATGWVVALTAIGSLMAALDTLVVSTSLSAIRLDLGASIEDLEWTVNAYNLSFAVLLIPAAGLGDRYGRRRLYAGGLGLFAAASAACALAPEVGWLVAARAVQGAGAALVLTLGLALLSAAFPPERRGAAIGLFSAVTGISVAMGPLVGGAIVEGIDWEWIFWLNVPIGLAAIPLVLTRIEESHGGDTGLDLPGLGLVSAAAFAIVWGLVRGNAAGWGSLEVVGALVAGVLLVAAFVARELRAPEPMLPVRFFRSRAFSAGNAAIFFTFASLFGAVFFFAQMLQTALGYGPLDAGLRLIPWTITFITVAPVVGALADRFGERPFMVGGAHTAGAGNGLGRADRRPGTHLRRVRASVGRRRRRGLDGDPRGAELRRRLLRARGCRQGRGRQQHDARARRCLRGGSGGGGLRRRRQLRVGRRLPRRVRARDRRRRGALARRRDHRPRPPGSPAGGRICSGRSGPGPRGRGRNVIT